jgi:uncharacterized protein
MKPLPSRYRRLDGALADLPVEEPMLLTELDGFLTGILVGPPLPATEWMQTIWGTDDNGVAPFDDPLDVQWFFDAVMARHDAILQDLERGRLRPILDVDERNGDVLWEMWMGGFIEAVELRPEAWEVPTDDAAVNEARAQLSLLMAVAEQRSPLDSIAINVLEETAPALLGEAVVALHAAQPRKAALRHDASPKVGRNDPCPCGSGKKAKRCCP